MAMTAGQRQEAAKWLAKELFVKPRVTAARHKDDILAALDAIDVKLDEVQGDFVAAIPEPYKAWSDASQKSLLLIAVAAARQGLDL